jgi:hypothetical protein
MRDLLAPGADDLPAAEQPGPLSRQEALESLARLFEALRQEISYDHAERQGAQAPRLPEETGIM